MKLDFVHTDKKKWEELIAKALKINSLDEFAYKKIAGVDIPAFNHPNTKITRNNPLKSHDQDWKIGIPIDTKAQDAHSAIMNAVENGAEALSLSGSNLNWNELYSGVFHEMIYSDILSSESPTAIQDFIDYSTSQGKKLDQLSGSFCISEEALKANVGAAKKLTKFHFLTGDSSSENIPEALVEISGKLKNAIELVDQLGLPISSIKASVTVDAHLPVNVAKLRALRIIWANLLQAYKHKFEALFIKVTTKVSQDSNKETALIENTSACINAALGTADMICSFDAHEKNSNRLNQNIQHIMKMESNLHSVSDPLAGSYAIEKMTNDLAEACWQTLVKN